MSREQYDNGCRTSRVTDGSLLVSANKCSGGPSVSWVPWTASNNTTAVITVKRAVLSSPSYSIFHPHSLCLSLIRPHKLVWNEGTFKSRVHGCEYVWDRCCFWDECIFKRDPYQTTLTYPWQFQHLLIFIKEKTKKKKRKTTLESFFTTTQQLKFSVIPEAESQLINIYFCLVSCPILYYDLKTLLL